jgi:hypothetical protein
VQYVQRIVKASRRASACFIWVLNLVCLPEEIIQTDRLTAFANSAVRRVFGPNGEIT